MTVNQVNLLQHDQMLTYIAANIRFSLAKQLSNYGALSPKFEFVWLQFYVSNPA